MPEITQTIGSMTGDQLLQILRGILEPKLAEKAAEIEALRSRITSLEGRLAAAEGRLSK